MFSLHLAHDRRDGAIVLLGTLKELIFQKVGLDILTDAFQIKAPQINQLLRVDHPPDTSNDSHGWMEGKENLSERLVDNVVGLFLREPQQDLLGVYNRQDGIQQEIFLRAVFDKKTSG